MIKLNHNEYINIVFKSKNTVPICFAANNSYLPQTAVMIQSIVNNASSNFFYDIIVLSTDIDPISEENLLIIKKKYSNISIRIFDISMYINNVNFFTKSVYTPTKYSKEAYFRLFIPYLMPKYNKVIYFDGDMVALKDVSDLIKIDISKHHVAATRDYCGIAACYDSKSDRKKYRQEIGINDINDYFISSLIIFNIKKIAKNKISIDYIKDLISSREWRQHDQDILNVLYQNKLLIIDAKWSYFDELKYTKKFLPLELKKELLEASKNPFVIHYAAEKKAWIDTKNINSLPFWKYAYQTNFFDIFYGKLSGNDIGYKYNLFSYMHTTIDYYYTFDDIFLLSTPHLIGRVGDLKVCIEFLEVKHNRVKLDGFFEKIKLMNSDLKLFINVNGKRQNLWQSDEPRQYAILDEIKKIYCFNTTIEIDRKIEKNIIYFEYSFDNIHFAKAKYISVEQFAPINENKLSFYSASGYILTKRKGNEICLEKHSHKKILTYNYRLCSFLWQKQTRYFRHIALARWLYYFTKPFYRHRQVILIGSVGNKLDDIYIDLYNDLKKQKNIRPYIVNGSKTFVGGNREKTKCIKIGSKLHKFLYMHAKQIIASEYSIKIFSPMFDRSNEIRDIISNKRFFILQRDKEDLSYNVKPWYAVTKFFIKHKPTYEKLLSMPNGYSDDYLVLLDSLDKQTIVKQIKSYIIGE